MPDFSDLITDRFDNITICQQTRNAQGLERHVNVLSRASSSALPNCPLILWKKGVLGVPIMAFQWYFVCFLVAGSFTPLAFANGSSGGHTSGSHEHGQFSEHSRYSNPFWGPWSPYDSSFYNSSYAYTPTEEQQARAKQQVKAYLLAVTKRRKHPATHRYISVETLRPTKKQLEDFARKQQPGRPVDPAQLHCLMVYDTQSREFVGSGCYVISTEPLAGAVTKFESVSAEFVGHTTL
jgi:hypothetical protein